MRTIMPRLAAGAITLTAIGASLLVFGQIALVVLGCAAVASLLYFGVAALDDLNGGRR